MKMSAKSIRFLDIEIYWSVVVLWLVAFRFAFLHRLLVAYGLTAMHECAHIAVTRRLGIKIEKVEILPFGITARLCDEGIKRTSDEIIIAVVGPLSNFLIAFMAYGLADGWWQTYIVCTSLVIGVFNLIPALPLDGGRILKAILVSRYGCIRGYGVTMKVTAFCGVAIVVVGVWVLYITGFNFSFLIIGAFLVANITEEIKASKIIVMKDILYSRRKLKETRHQRCGVMVVTDEQKAFEVLSAITYDKYYLINITDINGKILNTITETSFVEGLAVLGMNTSMRKFVGL